MKAAPDPNIDIDRILKATGLPLDESEKLELLANLESIRSIHRTGVTLRAKPAKHDQHIEKIIAAAEHLKSLLEDDVHRAWLLSLRSHLGPLNRLIRTVGKRKRGHFPPERLTALLGVGHESAFENTVANLARTFEHYFRIKASHTRDEYTGAIDQPFIRFAEAALDELGITNKGARYTRGATAAALSKFRNG